jgi:NADH dehydrogenase
MAIPDYLKLNVPDTNLPRIVIVGAGFGGLSLAKSLRGVSAQVVLLDRNNFHTFQPLLYQVATAGLEPDSIGAPLRDLFKNHSHFIFRMVRVTGFDLESHLIHTKIGSLTYDHLVIANGAVTNYFGKENFRDEVLPLKRIVHALDLRSQILQNFEKAELTDDPKILERLMNVVVVGGGPTGVEVAGALAELRSHILPNDYPNLNLTGMKIYLIQGAEQLLVGMSDKSAEHALNYLQKMNVDVRLSTFVENVADNKITIGTEVLEAETVIWAAGVKGRILEGVPETEVKAGRIMVKPDNSLLNYDNVYAIGDVALMQLDDYPKGHPMVAQVAIQQGALLARNFDRVIKNQPTQPFKYKDKGSMATIGRNKAVVDLPNGMHFKGFIAWLIWMFIHILFLNGFRNKLVTFMNWIWSYFTYDRGTRLIVRTFTLHAARKRFAQRDD